MINVNIRERLISNLITTSKNIKCLYDNMNNLNKDELEKQLKEEIQKEDFILDLLEINEENSKEIYDELSNSLNESLLDKITIDVKNEKLNKMFNDYFELNRKDALHTNDLVRQRFESYLIKKFKSEPTTTEKRIDKENNLINSYGPEAKEIMKDLKQDKAMIRHQANIDYYTSTIKFLDNHEKNTTDKEVINQTLFVKNQILFKDKEIEEKYYSNNLVLDGHKKCLENGHNQKFVDNIYNEFLFDNINGYGNKCYLYSNSSLSNPRNKVQFDITLQFFKAGLYLMDIEELKEISMDYQCTNMNNSKHSVKLIEDSMIEIIELKENENQKKLRK